MTLVPGTVKGSLLWSLGVVQSQILLELEEVISFTLLIKMVIFRVYRNMVGVGVTGEGVRDEGQNEKDGVSLEFLVGYPLYVHRGVFSRVFVKKLLIK